jgi:hypothetical protein
MTDGDVPVWYSPPGEVQVSEYRDWSDVVKWALKFYALDEPLPQRPAEEVKRLRGLFSKDAQIVGALEYVQDNVRYLSTAEGVHSHRPYPMADVMARGYGDCKDKALLLARMLRELGFSAWPALVASSYRHVIASWLPTPLDFDHVVVAVELEGDLYWIDPTSSHQGGDLHSRHFPAFGKALLIRSGETGLIDVRPAGFSAAGIKCDTVFDIPRYDAPVKMWVHTQFRGREADFERSVFAGSDAKRVEKNYLDFYARQFPGIEPESAPNFDDNKAANVLEITERYVIPKFWQPRQKDDRNLYAELSPDLVANVLAEPAGRARTAPIGQLYPKRIEQTFTVNLPEAGRFPPEQFQVEDDAFRYSSSVRLSGRTLKVSYNYESLSDHVPIERVPEYLGHLRKARENLGYPFEIPKELADGGTPSPSFVPNWGFILAAILITVLAIGCAVLYFLWRPDWRMGRVDPQFVGLKGWLILVGIGVVGRPIFMAFEMRHYVTFFDLGVWNTLAVPDGRYYDPLWVPILLGELFANIWLFVFAVLLVGLFFMKRRTFPLLLIILLAVSAVVALVDYILLAPLAEKFPELDLGSGSKEASRAIMQAVIWIPYLLVSKRVRSTFIRGRPRNRSHVPPPLPQ